MNRSRRLLAGAGALIALISLFGCQKAYEELSTPVKTVKTYLDFCEGVLNAIDPPSYNRTIRCFAKSTRAWWNKNFEKLPFVEQGTVNQDTYVILNDLQKRVHYFVQVVEAGPRGTHRAVSEEENSGQAAIVKVDGFAQPIHLVKEGPNWRIKGLWGLEKKY